MPPSIKTSTREERKQYITRTMHCISNCENCGLCRIYHGIDPVIVYADYINGIRSFQEIAEDYR